MEDAPPKKEADYPVAMLENPPNVIKGRVPIPQIDFDAREVAIEDLRWRIKLSKDVLPTIAFFTFAQRARFIVLWPTPPATCATSLAGFPIPSCTCGI